MNLFYAWARRYGIWSARARTRPAPVPTLRRLGSSVLPDLAATEILSEVREVGPNRRLVDRVGIEVRVIPLDHALVVQVFGIGDRLQKRLVADRSADIRGGTAALRAHEAGIADAGRGR